MADQADQAPTKTGEQVDTTPQDIATNKRSAPSDTPASEIATQDASSTVTPAEQPSSSSSASASTSNKRARVDHRGDNNTTTTGDNDNDDEKRLPKRKVAVLFGYCGVGYSGLQVNPDVKTIEGDIFDVMCEAGCISKENAVNPNKVQLQRAARTDRGVHAAGNLIALKLILNPPASPSGDEAKLVEYLNSKLPPLIRIWGIHRVQSSFNARMTCDSRKYQYLLPTYVFLPPKPGTAMWKMYKQWDDDLQNNDAGAAEGIADEEKQRLKAVLNHPFWADALQAYEAKSETKEGEESTIAAPADPSSVKEESQFKKDTRRKRSWRMSEDPNGAELLARVQRLFKTFLGTHNFHNYTVAKPFRDPSAKRTMRELEISDPFIVSGTEYLSVTLHGQSFMLHQIRKMIGLLVLVARSACPEKFLKETFNSVKIHVPKAPALGLLLNSPQFEGYNQKVGQHNNQLKNQLKSGKITDSEWESLLRSEISFKPYQSEMEEFRMKNIYQYQYETEEKEDEFAKWLNYLDSIVGTDFTFLNLKGVIPKEAINAGPDRIDKKGAGRKSGQPKSSVKKEDETYQESDEEELNGKGADLEG
ncbi:unnamed protein product [Sympodiomycopsis kandeliae]